MTIYLPNIKSLKDLINSKSIKKILIITGQNSFFKSQANQTFQRLLKQDQSYLKKKTTDGRVATGFYL